MQEQFLKLLIIGDSGVGKSCILSRFCENKFTQAFYNTIGVDFKTKTITLDDCKCKLQIWDTAGQERFRTITSNYYKGAHGIIVVFDLTNKESLENVSFWLQEIQRHGSQHAATILIGNKNDLSSKREITEEIAYSFAKKNKIDYVESSAFNALNINLVFETIVKKILRDRNNKESRSSQKLGNGAILSNQANKKKNANGCC